MAEQTWNEEQIKLHQKWWQQLSEPILPGSIWMHSNGKMYEVLGITNLKLHKYFAAESCRQPMVVYRGLGRSDWFSRPLEQFREKFNQKVSLEIDNG